MARSVADLVSRIERAERTLRDENRVPLRAAAVAFKRGIEGQFAKDGLRVGSTLAGRPWKGVGFEEKSDREVLVRARPPAHLFTNPTSPHLIVPKKIGGSRRSRVARFGAVASSRQGRSQLPMGPITAAGKMGVRAAILPGTGPKAYARHPGTKGTGSFGKGVKASRKPAAEAYMKTRRKELASIFTG